MPLDRLEVIKSNNKIQDFKEREKRTNLLKDLAIEYSIKALSSPKFKKAEKLSVAMKVIPTIMPKTELDLSIGFSLSKLFDKSQQVIDLTPQEDIDEENKKTNLLIVNQDARTSKQ